MSGTIPQRQTIVPAGHPLLIARYAPIHLPHDTKAVFDQNIALMLNKKYTRPEVVVTSQNVPVARRPEPPRDIGRLLDRSVSNRRPIVAGSVAEVEAALAAEFG